MQLSSPEYIDARNRKRKSRLMKAFSFTAIRGYVLLRIFLKRLTIGSFFYDSSCITSSHKNEKLVFS